MLVRGLSIAPPRLATTASQYHAAPLSTCFFHGTLRHEEWHRALVTGDTPRSSLAFDSAADDETALLRAAVEARHRAGGLYVKFHLTVGEILRLLRVRGASKLCTARSIQSTENAHDNRNPHSSVRAGALRRHRHRRFRSCLPVRDAGGVVRNTGSLERMTGQTFHVEDVDSQPPCSSLSKSTPFYRDAQ